MINKRVNIYGKFLLLFLYILIVGQLYLYKNAKSLAAEDGEKLLITEVKPSVVMETSNVCRLGSMVKIEVKGEFQSDSIEKGTIRISSSTNRYDSGSNNLTLSEDGTYFFYHWDTYELKSASDYAVEVNLNDKDGKTTTNSDLIITLKSGIPDKITLKGGVPEYRPTLVKNTDLYFVDRGLSPKIVRSYRNYSTSNGILGQKWTHSYNINLTEWPDGTVRIYEDLGGESWYVRNDDGSFKGYPYDYSELSKNSDGTFQRRHKDGRIESFDSQGRINSISDTTNNTVTFKYNEKGLLESITSPSGSNISLNYDSSGRISSIIGPTGKETDYQYDEYGNLVAVTNPAGFKTQYEYDSNHRLKTITDPKGNQTKFTYDEKGNLTSETNEGENNAIYYEYSQTEPEVTLTNALGNKTVIKYTERADKIASITDSLGNTTNYSYDDDRNLTKLVDANGNESVLSYDERGNLVSYEDPSGNTTTLAYDEEYNKVTALTDVLKRVTQFWYDSKGNLTEITYPDNSSEKFSYNEYGNVTKKTDRKGNTTFYRYDSMGRLKMKKYPDSSKVSCTYDSDGNLTAVKDKNGVIRNKYDSLNRIVYVKYPKQKIIQYEYDANENQTKFTYPDNSVLESLYDEANRLVQIKNNSGEILVKYEYDKMGNWTRKELVNGVYTTYTDDAANRLTELVNKKPSGETISSFQYTYDKVGNRLTMTTENGSYSYTYDNNYQLTSVVYPDGKEVEYGYDSLGNRVSVAVNGESVKYLTNDLNQYTSVGGDNYEYDANGNLINSGENTYEYDYENRLVKVITTQGSVSYSYDPFGRRISKTNNTNGNTYYLWTHNQVIMEEDKSRKKLATYVYGVGIDEPIVMQRGGTNYYYTHDGLWNVIDLIDTDENVIESYEYDAFGAPSKTSSVGNPYMFTGREYESESGLCYYRARYYTPTIGRFMTEDPIYFAGGLNLYTYVRNNPVNFTDPLGWQPGNSPGPKNPGPDWGNPCPMCSWNPPPPNPPPPPGGDGGDGGGNSSEPTFIHPPKQRICIKTREKKQNVSSTLTAQISVPYERSLVRATIPVFGLVYGKGFKEYRVEYGEGKNPKDWILIKKSSKPQTKDVTPADMDFSADITIHGNLASWDTGLKSYVYLPDYPPDHPIDLNGVYTLRLVVVGKHGEEIEDRVTVEVGEAIPNAWGGMVESKDKKVALNIPEQSLMDTFYVISIKPVEDSGISLDKNRKRISSVYEFREPGEKFTKDVALEIEYSEESLKGFDLRKLGIYSYNSEKKEWVYLKSLRDEKQKKIVTVIRELSPYYAIFASDLECEWSVDKEASLPVVSWLKSTENINTNGDYLVMETFEEGMGEWSNRDGDVGAEVIRDNKETYDGTFCLKLTNTNYGGNFASNVRQTPFDAREHPIVQFDYKIPTDVRINFLVKSRGKWYEIDFTDDQKELKYKRVNINNIGKIEGIVADNNWHTARFNLYEMLRTKTGNHVIEEMIMADWDVSGYMKLRFGTNRERATYYIDNFMISKDTASGLKIDNDILLVDNFNQKKETNFLCGQSAIFADSKDSVGGNYRLNFAEDNESNRKGHSLKISYNVLKPGNYAGYLTQLQRLDLRDYKKLSFIIRGSKGGEMLKIGLKDYAGNESKVSINDFLPHGVNVRWQRVEIPLVVFSDIKSWKALENISFSFENATSCCEGTVFIDDIQFEKCLDSFIVDDFKKGDGKNLLGGRSCKFSNGACAVNCDYVKGYIDKALRISYGGNIGDLFTYAGWTTRLEGIDISQCDTLSFYIKGDAGGEEPNVYLSDGIHKWGVEIKKYTRVTSSWEKVCIPIKDFADYGVDLTHIEEFQIVFEWKRQSGTVFIDNIRFDCIKNKVSKK